MANDRSNHLSEIMEVAIKEEWLGDEMEENKEQIENNKHVVYLPDTSHSTFHAEGSHLEIVKTEDPLTDVFPSNNIKTESCDLQSEIDYSHTGLVDTATTIANVQESSSLTPHARVNRIGFNCILVGVSLATKPEVVTHTCAICSKQFCGEGRYMDHMNVHADKSAFKCELCGKNYATKHSLRKHKLIHFGIKPHQCRFCEKKFTEGANLKTHMLIHTGDTPHQCSVCPRQFNQATNLRRHMLLHTGVKPYECRVCRKTFAQVGTLKKHEQIHSKGKSWPRSTGTI